MLGESVRALLCTLLPIVACIVAGSAVGRGRSRWPGADMLVGFGLLTAALTVLAVTTRIPLSWLMAGLGISSVIALLIRRQFPGGSSTWIALILVSPIFVSAAGHDPAMWDDFWNWLPSAAYEYRHNSLPWPDLPASLSIFPGYPQGMPLMISAASFVGWRFLEAAGPIINALLLAGSSALFAEALAAALVRGGRLQAVEMPPILVAVAVAITTLLNPGLDGGVVLSSYADCGTMVAVGALGLLGVEILLRLSAADAEDVEGLAWRFGFIGAMLVNLKQANPVLLALVTAGLILVALRVPALRTWRALVQLPRMLGPAIVFVALWRWYVVQSVPNSEQTFRSFDTWNFDVLRQILASIGHLIAEAPLFHSMMWAVTAVGIAAFFQLPRKASEARWLAVVCATVWIGYNAFLMIIYLGVMTVSDANIAADYWRYTPHVALLGLYVPVMALAIARWPAWINLRSAFATLAVASLAFCAMPLRSDLNNPPGRAWLGFLRSAAVDIRNLIPAGSKLLIVPYWSSSPFGVAVRYNLWRLDQPERQIAATIGWVEGELEKVASRAARGELDYLLIQDGEGTMDDETDTLGLPRLNHELVLYAWRDGGWQRAKSWPIPPALIYRGS
ncbi:MAG: hypothetical protein QOI87_4120 [Bradyrhizobium sp.]|jgi:hypothetical protein|nr:hypothetical protein [Bradyrhizobium sp.]